MTYSFNVAVQKYHSMAFSIEAEKFSAEKPVKDCAYLPQALIIMTRLDKTSTKLRSIYLNCSSNRSQLGTKLFLMTL